MPNSEQTFWFVTDVQPHVPQLRSWLQSRFPPIAGELDDVIQEACMRVLAARERRNAMHAPKAFLFATARNLALDLLRRRQVVRIESLGDNDDWSVLEGDDDVTETVARNQEIEIMTAAIQSLPERCRQVMTLRNVYGLSQKEIGAELAISVHTVEAQITIGIRRCTEFVRRLRDHPPSP